MIFVIGYVNVEHGFGFIGHVAQSGDGLLGAHVGAHGDELGGHNPAG
jgi:hypothetical protein